MSKRTIVKTASYTAHAIDMVSIMIFNSTTDCTLTLPSPTGAYGADCDVHNKGAGTVTIGTQTVATGSHAHISNDGGTLMSQVDMLMGIDETQYGRYQDEGKRYADVLGVVMDMDETQYQRWTDAYTRRYQTERDKITDAADKVEADRQKIKDAWERTSELGYVDNAFPCARITGWDFEQRSKRSKDSEGTGIGRR